MTRVIAWRRLGSVARLRDPFDRYLRAAAAMLAGLLLGFLLTVATLRGGYGFGEYVAGPWSAWPQLGDADTDPYARAALAQRGVAPLARSEGLAFVAQTDSSGAALDGGCEYLLSGPVPPTRFWSLALSDAAGAPLANATQRYAFTSSEILRREGGAFEIAISREARAGNWLSPGEARGFVIVLRLYDVGFDAAERIGAERFPRIVKLGCS
ncbi:MAG TPA: DUF1214 domain-containing protein [Methylocystis sp.]|nr:DUF1214 domain-containing protein [Methylocystis sp.]